MTTEANNDERPYPEYGNPTGFGMKGTPQFNTDKIVDWRCPHCGEDGFHKARLRDSFVLCTNRECPIKAFTCFRGEPE